MQNPLSRIPTVDLATAAENDRRRRAADFQNATYLVATSSAPLPPSLLSEASLGMAENTKWKDVAPKSESVGLSRSGTANSNESNEMLSIKGNALSSSAQLSPGTDALRRRSPRQVQASATKGFEIVRPGEPVRIPIPRAPEPSSDSSSEKSQETIKTPLQRRPTNGLPSNPRAAAIKGAANHARSRTEQTVMLKNATYSEPDAAAGALSRSNTMPADSRSSVVHRPRPIPRKNDKDRQVFPAEILPPQHRRAKSGGSIISKRSILNRAPGSPTELPPLPPPPKSAGATSRPLPNNTKSMTFDEKMELFYAPPLSAISSYKRSPEDKAQRRAMVTSGSSVQTTDVFDVTGEAQKPAMEPQPPQMPPVSRWSDDPSQADTKRRFPSGVAYSQSNMSGRDDDAMTNWGSVHSPVAAVHVRQAMLNARTTYIQKDSSRVEGQDEKTPSVNNQPTEVVTVMLDTSSTVATRQTPSPQDDKNTINPPTPKHRSSRQFHRRVGDECLTFSGRDRAQSRKGPPPAPLLLKGKGDKKVIVAQPAEPSPLESPEAVYQMIQDQLRNLEELNEQDDENENRRVALLEDLELEMGQQQNKWQTLHMDIHRDSMSTVQTSSPSKGSRPVSLADVLSQDVSQRRASRLSGVTARSREENAPELILKHNNVNYLAVSKATLGSPSPPDTDESESEAEDEQILQSSSFGVPETTPLPGLWVPEMVAITTGSSGLWKPSVVTSSESKDYDLPGSNLRPKPRKTLEPLAVESLQMWQKNIWMSELSSTGGLWQKRVPIQRQQTKKVASRPLTTRPPRRNRRLTQLPDILESPEPLDRRGTLGIFRFATGEKSESATVQTQTRPGQILMAMPGTMTTGVPTINVILQARAERIQDAELAGSSYFDEFDEESGDNFDFSDGEDMGDEFDETTLWEIASLLQAEREPSRDSLLSAAFSPSERVDSLVLDGSDMDIPSDDESESASVVDLEMVPKESSPANGTPAVFIKPTPVQHFLWSHEAFAREKYHPGLPQPDTDVWKTYIVEAGDNTRSRSQVDEVLSIQSFSLWMPSAEESNVSFSAGLWAKPHTTIGARTSAKISLLWNVPRLTPTSPLDGLFNTTSRRSNYRKTSVEPAALHMTRKPSIRREPVAELTTRNLWSAQTPYQLVSRSTRPSLWTKAIAVTSATPSLFKVDPERRVYRTTTAEPAAIQMERRPRKLQDTIQKIESGDLWAIGNQVTIELDWLTISSIPPRSPSLASVTTDSSASSPVSDMFSVKTNVTRASTVADSTRTGRSVSGGSSHQTKQETEIPELPKLPEEFLIKNLDEVLPEKPTRVPLRKMYHPDTVYPADWAVAASYPTKRAIPRVPPAEWDVQLHAAIQASRIERRLTRVMAAHQEWSTALNSVVAASYPQSGSTENVSANPLWSKPTAQRTEVPKGLWAATSVQSSGVDAPRVPELSIGTLSQRPRKSSESAGRPDTLDVSPEFRAQRLWRRRDATPSAQGLRSSARDWLEDTTKRRFSRLELRY